MLQNLKITKGAEVNEKNLMYLRGDTVMLVGKIWVSIKMDTNLKHLNEGKAAHKISFIDYKSSNIEKWLI